MFMTSTDWEMADASAVQEAADKVWPIAKEAGAVNFKGMVNGNQLRTFIIWPDQASAEAALAKMRPLATEMTGNKVLGTAAGELMFDLS